MYNYKFNCYTYDKAYWAFSEEKNIYSTTCTKIDMKKRLIEFDFFCLYLDNGIYILKWICFYCTNACTIIELS